MSKRRRLEYVNKETVREIGSGLAILRVVGQNGTGFLVREAPGSFEDKGLQLQVGKKGERGSGHWEPCASPQGGATQGGTKEETYARNPPVFIVNRSHQIVQKL